MQGRSLSWKTVALIAALGVPLIFALTNRPNPEPAMATPVVESPRGGFVHAVYFWLRPDLTAEQRADFVRGLESLRGIETVRHGWIGTPADTDRPIIERSYDYALTVVFADPAGQDAYQVDPVHDRFREQFGDYFARVQIFDSLEQPAPRR